MIELAPAPPTDFSCPNCGDPLADIDWYMPGMRCLVELRCPDCSRSYYGDLPAGHGLYYPSLIDSSGDVYAPSSGRWFAEWLAEGYANRTDDPVDVDITTHHPVSRPLVLNCLDALYGHALLKLLNAQAHLEVHVAYDLIVIVPPSLEWLVPDGVAEVWVVDVPVSQGRTWNDWLAERFHSELAEYDIVWLSRGFSHPHPSDVDIERFSGVEPFPVSDWSDRLDEPTVTFVWRDDRCWSSSLDDGRLVDRCLGAINGVARQFDVNLAVRQQRRRVVALATRLRDRYDGIDFAVAGIGSVGSFPDWIADRRVTSPTVEDERALCRRYAQSHLVVGVHGSNMLLPSAHAGGTIELVPQDRWGNVTQDLRFRDLDLRETVYHTRLLPISSPPTELSTVLENLLDLHDEAMVRTARSWCDHRRGRDPFEWRSELGNNQWDLLE